MNNLFWGDEAFAATFVWGADAVPWLAKVEADGVEFDLPQGLPLIDVTTVGEGHRPASNRLVHTSVGERLRYVGHTVDVAGDWLQLVLKLVDPITHLSVDMCWEKAPGVAGFTGLVKVTNAGQLPLALRAVVTASWYLGSDPNDWTLHHAHSEWLAENRWTSTSLASALPRVAAELTGQNPRGELSFSSSGTWSTGKYMPVAAATSESAAWMWQIEHNGPWRWEVGRDNSALYVALSGPTHSDHSWLRVLKPGESFLTVPATAVLARDFTSAVAQLTRYRRARRRAHSDNEAMPVVFNDYMNTLDGDPTTEKLLPLVDAAAAVGAEVFCIDAGWYDDGGDWWDSVGEWRASTSRFPNGLEEITDRIILRGMVPGLWLEPEVIGVNSPIAQLLPDEAFLTLGGERLVEHERYHLDLRHPEALAHLDSVVDRLITDYGIGYFKLDYNIDPRSGSDRDTDSVGDALLSHNRAHLEWLDAVLDRHPSLILENCASGGMRSDAALLSRMQLQSTSDQQDFLLYPPIAASAPLIMLPEQAANWAYPQPGMDDEQFAFCLITGLLGRFFLSGRLDNATPAQRKMVSDAVALAKQIRPLTQRAAPFWPIGLPSWDDPWIVLGLSCGDETLIAVWCRDPSAPPIRFAGPHPEDHNLITLFPIASGWNVERDRNGAIRLQNTTASVGARLFHLAPIGAPSTITIPTNERTALAASAHHTKE